MLTMVLRGPVVVVVALGTLPAFLRPMLTKQMGACVGQRSRSHLGRVGRFGHHSSPVLRHVRSLLL